MTDKKICGYDWSDIQDMQQGNYKPAPIKQTTGDYGTDPVGNGMVKMVPSGDVVTVAEAQKRLGRD